MKLCIALFLMVSGAVAFRTLNRHPSVQSAVSTESEAAKPANANATPVVVELFTSEGCSSCPPADEVLSRLDKMQPIQGVEVIALGEHVDYWNRLGWSDPYSSEDFSRRQSRYADAFNHDGVYTPQMIVDGRDEFAGGNMERARIAITKAAQAPKANVQLASSQNSEATNSRKVKLLLHVSDLPGLTAGDTAEVLLAITENNLRSEVSRGENAGRYLRHSAVVRQLTALGEIGGSQNSFAAEPTVNLDNRWQRDNLRAVAFVQERGTRRVLGAAAVSLSTK
ncbi:MAG TPA: DUF1223 domain-containing protein [Pyrinomonadaceae bacterium]|jgi:hypothetical protein|nr:DUF1223 domain-containing protein [Pyrinomonadaceae bacterium]